MDPRIYRQMDRCTYDLQLTFYTLLNEVEAKLNNFYRTYPVYAVGEAGTMYTPASNQYYTSTSTPVTYAQVYIAHIFIRSSINHAN